MTPPKHRQARTVSLSRAWKTEGEIWGAVQMTTRCSRWEDLVSGSKMYLTPKPGVFHKTTLLDPAHQEFWERGRAISLDLVAFQGGLLSF